MSEGQSKRLDLLRETLKGLGTWCDSGHRVLDKTEELEPVLRGLCIDTETPGWVREMLREVLAGKTDWQEIRGWLRAAGETAERWATAKKEELDAMANEANSTDEDEYWWMPEGTHICWDCRCAF